MTSRWSRWLPLTGLIAIVFIVLAFLIGGETPDVDDSAAKVAKFYADNEGSQFAAAILLAYGALFLIFFGAVLRDALRGAAGPAGGLPSLVFGGALLVAVGMTIFAGLTFTLADAHDDIRPAASQALNALNSDLFMPLAVGTAVFLLASGISLVRTGHLPRWLGWVAIVLGVLAVTPLGFFAFLAMGLWILIVSVMLTMRASGADRPAAGTPPPPTAA